MSTIENLWDVDPEPDPKPGPRRKGYTRDPAVEDWTRAQEQYERYLDRLGGDQR